ncbi:MULTISPECIES: hypothetical protein [Streptomyces]
MTALTERCPPTTLRPRCTWRGPPQLAAAVHVRVLIEPTTYRPLGT